MAICTYRYVFSPPKFIWNYFVFIWIPKHKFKDQTQKKILIWSHKLMSCPKKSRPW